MFSSIRSRLLLTYLLLVTVVLGAVIFVLVLFLLRNPRPARQAETNLVSAADTIERQREEVLGTGTPDEVSLRKAAGQADQLLNVRVLLLGEEGRPIADSRRNTEAFLPVDQIRSRPPDGPPITEIRDFDGNIWLYTTRPYTESITLVAAVPRPESPVQAVFSDEFFLPVVEAGAVALVLAVLLAFFMTRSITAPLRGVSQAAEQLAEGNLLVVDPEGPSEIQTLARTFNEMGAKVTASQQSQRDFVANISHELRTPLTSIQGFAQAILDGTARGANGVQKAAQVIQNESLRMQRLVQDLLELARMDAGGLPLDLHPVDIATLLADVQEKFTPMARQANVSLKVQAASDLRANADYERLVQVFSNLGDNALKYTPKGSSIHINAQAHGKEIEISVSDEGPGLPPQEAKRVFERFYQVDKSRKTGNGRDAGLGLSIAHQLVEAHGGSMRVASVPGQGASFIVRLPALS